MNFWNFESSLLFLVDFFPRLKGIDEKRYTSFSPQILQKLDIFNCSANVLSSFLSLKWHLFPGLAYALVLFDQAISAVLSLSHSLLDARISDAAFIIIFTVPLASLIEFL